MRVHLLTVLLAIVSASSLGGVGFQGGQLRGALLGFRSQEMTDKEIVQSIFEGIFAENQLEAPVMVKYCFDDEIARETVQFIDDALPRAAKGSPSNLLFLLLQTSEFVKGLPYAFLECLARCDEIRTLGYLYDLDQSTDFQKVQSKVEQYVILHYLGVHGWANDLNSQWQRGDHFGVGYYGALDAHKIQYWRPA